MEESLRASIGNGRILLFVALIMFSYYSMKELADTFILKPRVADFLARNRLVQKNGSFADADPAIQKAILKDIQSFLSYELVALAFLFLILVFSAVASVHSTFEAYTAKVLSLTEALLGTKRRWKRALTTSIWMLLIILASATFLLSIVGAVGAMAGVDPMGSVPSSLTWALIVLGGGFAAYICSLWVLALVVSVIEENMSALKAITQAKELIEGKKQHNFMLIVIIILAI